MIIMTKAPGKHPFNLLAYRHAVVPTIHTTYDKHHHQPPVLLVTLWPVRERTVLARPSFASRLSLSLSLSLSTLSSRDVTLSLYLSSRRTVTLFTTQTSYGRDISATTRKKRTRLWCPNRDLFPNNRRNSKEFALCRMVFEVGARTCTASVYH